MESAPGDAAVALRERHAGERRRDVRARDALLVVPRAGLDGLRADERVAERDRNECARGECVAAAKQRGVLVYSGTGQANGVDGDTLLLGPPFVVTEDELDRIVEVTAEAIEAGVAEAAGVAR